MLSSQALEPTDGMFFDMTGALGNDALDGLKVDGEATSTRPALVGSGSCPR